MFIKGEREVERLGWKQRRTNMYEAHPIRLALSVRYLMHFTVPRILSEVGISQIIFQFLLAFLYMCALGWML